MQKLRKLTRASLAGTIRIFRPRPRFRRQIVKLFTVPNPAFEQLQRFSPWETKADPNIQLADYDPIKKVLEVPRGADPRNFPAKLRKEWERIKFRDRRNFVPVKFPEARLSYNAEQKSLMKDFKHALRDNSRPYGTFLYVAPTSIGKTITQASLAAITGQRTLVLVPTDLIKRAWYEDIEKLFGITKKDIGLIQREQ